LAKSCAKDAIVASAQVARRCRAKARRYERRGGRQGARKAGCGTRVEKCNSEEAKRWRRVAPRTPWWRAREWPEDAGLKPGATRGGTIRLVFVFLEEFLGVESGHAARTRGGDGLAVAMVLHIAGNKDARSIREAAMAWN